MARLGVKRHGISRKNVVLHVCFFEKRYPAIQVKNQFPPKPETSPGLHFKQTGKQNRNRYLYTLQSTAVRAAAMLLSALALCFVYSNMAVDTAVTSL